MIAIVAVFVGYGIGIFASSNIVLPVLWAWPKARRLGREGKLKKSIPVYGFLAAPVVWTLLALGSLLLAAGLFPAYSTAYFIGLLAGVVQVSRLVFKPNKDMEDDFAATYGNYLR